jgi:hypothetical protein
MAKPESSQLRKGEIVYAADDLPGVPAGTRGKVSMVSGIRWTRSRVQFDNGESRGSLDRHLLLRESEQQARRPAH